MQPSPHSAASIGAQSFSEITAHLPLTLVLQYDARRIVTEQEALQLAHLCKRGESAVAAGLQESLCVEPTAL